MTEERKEEMQNVKNEKVASSRARRPYHKNNKKTEKVEGKAPRVKKEAKAVEENKRFSNYTWSRRPYWSYTICFKTNKYTNLCYKINNWIN